MRIAFFHNLPAGGAKRVAFEFVQVLVKNHSIDLYTYDKSSEDFYDLGDLVNSHVIIDDGDQSNFKLLGRFISKLRVKKASYKLANLINEGSYDVVLVMQCKISNSPYLLRYINIPSLYVCHEPAAKIN